MGSNQYGRAKGIITITISEQHYIESILKHENLTDCNPVSMPMDPKVKILPNLEGRK